MVKFFLVEAAHPDLSSRLDMIALIFHGIISLYSSLFFQWNGVDVDYMVPMTTSSILRYVSSVSLTWSCVGLYVCFHRDECVRGVSVCIWFFFLRKNWNSNKIKNLLVIVPNHCCSDQPWIYNYARCQQSFLFLSCATNMEFTHSILIILTLCHQNMSYFLTTF